ncbi:YcnI family protein [Nocardioides seonyuensis]|nr:YcnI family protein [Nocardioides seonyuensis]
MTGASNRGFRRAQRTLLAGLALGAMVLPSTAWAHVTVQPGEVEGGGFSVVSFRVPTERDDASTTKVQVLLPEDQPIGSVRTRPVPGWKVTTKNRTLDEPIDMFGEEVDSVVSEVTWTATGEGIAPNQFEDFDVSMGQLPESGEMVFTAIQTYSSGEVVKWNEVAVDEQSEPEHPAPVLTITAPEAADAEAATEAEAAGATASEDDGDGSTVVPVVLSGLALLAAMGALFVALRRRA